MTLDMEIDTLLEAMSQERPEPSAALLTRIMIDADHIQLSFNRPSRISIWAQRLMEALPQPRFTLPMGSLSGSALALLVVFNSTLSMTPNEDMQELAGVFISDLEEYHAMESDAPEDPVLYAWLSGWNTEIALSD
jgi:hypothetical protein